MTVQERYLVVRGPLAFAEMVGERMQSSEGRTRDDATLYSKERFEVIIRLSHINIEYVEPSLQSQQWQ